MQRFSRMIILGVGPQRRVLPVLVEAMVVVIPVHYGPHLYPYPKTSALISNPNPNRGLQPRLFP